MGCLNQPRGSIVSSSESPRGERQVDVAELDDALLADRVEARLPGLLGRLAAIALVDRHGRRPREHLSVRLPCRRANEIRGIRNPEAGVVGVVDVALREIELPAESQVRGAATLHRERLSFGGQEVDVQAVRHLRAIDALADASGRVERATRACRRLVHVDRADVHVRVRQLDRVAVHGEGIARATGSGRIGREGDELVARRPVARIGGDPDEEKRDAREDAPPHEAPPRVIPTVSKIIRGAPAVNDRSGASVGSAWEWKSEA